MGLLQARVTARRYHVSGELHDNYREVYRDRLQEFAFVEPPAGFDKSEVIGWTQISDLLGTDFGDFNTWYIDSWIVFGLRIDKRVLPAKKFKATLDRKCREWCTERDIDRCPASVRTDIKDALESEWLRRTIPRTRHHEIAWNIETNQLFISTYADGVCDIFRKRFFRTFGRKLLTASPLDWIKDDSDLIDSLVQCQPLSFGGPS